jgi:hypothetical protein
MRCFATSALVALSLQSPFVSAEEVYRCVTSGGEVIYQQSSCPSESTQRKIELWPQPTEEESERARSLAEADRAYQRSLRPQTQSPSALPQTGSNSARTSLSPLRLRDSYLVEVAHNDEIFIINGEKFEAKTYCFDLDEGDEVLFLDGSAYGACASATVLNVRTRSKCELWCE